MKAKIHIPHTFMDPSVSGREQSGIFPEEPRENGRNFNPSLPNVPAEVQRDVSTDVHEVIGEPMRNVPASFHDASNAARASLADPSLHNVRREQAFPSSSAPMMEGAPARKSTNPFSPQKITSEMLGTAALSGGVAAAAVGVPTYFGFGALPAGLVAGTVGWQMATAGAATYGAGVLHNAIWHKEGEEAPGLVGTVLRGVIAPLSVPLGLIRNLTCNRKG